METGNLPHFLGIGAQKAGTTWLAHNLAAHPDIYIPARKEIHYFDRDWKYPTSNVLAPAVPAARPLGIKRHNRLFRKKVRRQIKHALRQGDWSQLRWDMRYYFGACDDNWYASLFREGAGKVIGEVTPAYSVLDEADVAHVKALMPRCRVIFVLRNPIDRAWSQVRMQIRKKRLRARSSIEEVQPFLDAPAQRLRSDYVRTLAAWEKHFPKEQMFIGFYDDIVSDPRGFMEQVFEFLSIDPASGISSNVMSARINSSLERDMPEAVRHYLCEQYMGMLEALSNRFGGHATEWFNEARAVVGK